MSVGRVHAPLPSGRTSAASARSPLCLFVDVGSTFTKLVVADPISGELLATAQDRTTIEDDVVRGYNGALERIPADLVSRIDWAAMSSSAAGGLRIASIGLTQALSGHAGKLAALGAGGKIVLEYSGRLSSEDLETVAEVAPHIVLLSGGVDGGNAEVIVHNARAIAALKAVPPVIIAGNRDAAEIAARTLRDSSDVLIADNVFPGPGRVEIDSTRAAVVELFIKHITKAKGLERLMALLGSDCEPTPLAVSRGTQIAASATTGAAVLVDVGGATTDVHSVGGRQHRNSQVELAEPDVIRTVEGDIGMRWGATGIVDAMGAAWCQKMGEELGVDIYREASRRGEDPGFLANDQRDRRVDAELARAALMIALERHAGRVVVRHNPWGNRYRIQGKDLRRAKLLISTGGIFRHADDREALVSGALADAESRMLPTAPSLVFDDHYAMFAVGLSANRDRNLAERLLRHALAVQPTQTNSAEELRR